MMMDVGIEMPKNDGNKMPKGRDDSIIDNIDTISMIECNNNNIPNPISLHL